MAPSLQCPVDETELQSLPWEADIKVDQCLDCRGVLVQVDELEKIQEIHENDHSDELAAFPDTILRSYEMAMEKSRRPLDCPGCGGEMERREYAYCSQILVDVCPGCRHLWLDAGELRELEVFFERSERETSPLRHGFLRSLRRVFFEGSRG